MAMSLTLRERPDTERLLKVARHIEIYDDQRERLESFARLAGEDGVEIKYKARMETEKGEPFGRIYPTPYRMNSTYQWNRVRATLYHDKEYDIDIVNAQPSILLGYCQEYERKGIIDECDFEALKEYVEDRQSKIDEFYINEDAIERYNKRYQDNRTPKDVFKSLIIMLSFGSNVTMWAKKYELRKDDYIITQWVKRFEMEMIYLSKVIVKYDVNSKTAIECWRAKVMRKKNLKKKEADELDINDRKVLSLILQDRETKIVMKAIEKLQDKGFTVTSYIYDGFQVSKDKEMTPEILDEIGCPEFNCRFIIKPFSEPLELDDEKLMPEPPSHFRPSLLNALGFNGEDFTSGEQLQAQKEYFEKYFAFVEGSTKIMELNSGKVYYHSATNMKARFANCFYAKLNPKTGKAEQGYFCDWWSKQQDKVQYRSVECIPPPLYCPPNVKNLWEGWPIERIPYDESADDSYILELIENVSGRQPAVTEYLMNYLAKKAQLPGEKNEVCLVFVSKKEGTGKTMFAEGIIGGFLLEKKDEYVLSTDKAENVVGRFSTAGEKLLTVMNEANLGNTSNFSNELKSFITDKTFFKEIKGVQGEQVRNICELIATTNNDNAFKVAKEDRRFQIIEPDSSHAKDRDYFAPIAKSLANPVIMRKFYQRLIERDISEFDPCRDRVVTKIYQQMQGASLSNIQEFIMDLCDNECFEKKDLIDFKEVYEYYRNYCAENGKMNKIVPTKRFTATIKRDVPGIDSKRLRSGDGDNKKSFIEFDWNKIREWVEEQHSLLE